MWQCSIRGCKECVSEVLQPEKATLWYVYDPELWPNIPKEIGQSDVIGRQIASETGWKIGDKIYLCPEHRREVFRNVAQMYGRNSPTGRSEDVP